MPPDFEKIPPLLLGNPPSTFSTVERLAIQINLADKCGLAEGDISVLQSITISQRRG
jgi:hypothetical protein